MAKATSIAADLFNTRDLVAAVKGRLIADAGWADVIREVESGSRGLHLGVFVEPFLGYIFDGSKTVESRFSVHRCPPWGRVHAGDLVLLKASGGPVVGICQLGQVWSYRLEPATWAHIRAEFTNSLRAQDPAFWASRGRASYATLMRVNHVARFAALACNKRDRRGWVVLHERPGTPVLAGVERGAP